MALRSGAQIAHRASTARAERSTDGETRDGQFAQHSECHRDQAAQYVPPAAAVRLRVAIVLARKPPQHVAAPALPESTRPTDHTREQHRHHTNSDRDRSCNTDDQPRCGDESTPT
jgi:hypothetical protein